MRGPDNDAVMHPTRTDDGDNGSRLSLGVDGADGLVACRIERDSDVVERFEPDAREYGQRLLVHRPEAFDHRVVDHVMQRTFEVVDDREPQRRDAAALFLSMIVFVGVLALGLAYAWRKGVLEWR